MKIAAVTLFLMLISLHAHALNFPMGSLAIDANSDLTLHSINVNDTCFDMTLNSVADPANASRLVWVLGGLDPVACGSNAAGFGSAYVDIDTNTDLTVRGLEADGTNFELQLSKNGATDDQQFGNLSWSLGDIASAPVSELDYSGTWTCRMDSSMDPTAAPRVVTFELVQSGNEVIFVIPRDARDPNRQDYWFGEIEDGILQIYEIETNSTNPDCVNYDGTGEFTINAEGNQITGSLTGHSCTTELVTFSGACTR